MLFHNPTDRTQKFELGNRHYEVPAGHNVEVPEALAYALKQRRSPLKAGAHPDPKAPKVASREALPAEIEHGLGRIERRKADAFREAWLRSGAGERRRMRAALERAVEQRGELDDGDDDAGEPTDPAEGGASLDEVLADAQGQPEVSPDERVDAQLADAAKVVGRDRPASKRRG